MIKYFYYESHRTVDGWESKNERVLDWKPETSVVGYKSTPIENKSFYSGWTYYVDVERRIEIHGKLDSGFQQVYDKLLFEQRNNKLDTL